MLRLAEKSDGIHRFIQEPQQLVAFFQEEFDNVMAVVATAGGQDQGKIEEAKAALTDNVDYPMSNSARFGDNDSFRQISGVNLIGRNLIEDDAQNYFRNGMGRKTARAIDEAIAKELAAREKKAARNKRKLLKSRP